VVSDSEALLAGLDAEQRVAAEALLGPVCVLAGAGTGKTRAITHRIAYGVASGVYSPQRVMAVTFTSRAAGELRTRLRALGAGGVAARTFHAAALAQLNFFWPQVVGGQTPRILEGKARLLAHAADSLRVKLDTAALRDLAAEIEWRKVSKLSLEQYAAAAVDRALPPRIDVEKAVALQRAYEDLKDERKQIDFEDVLLAAAGMIAAEPRVAAQVREQYRFFVVDEYQDVSPLQHDLLSLWLGDRTDVCVVGDASQTIYSFAGASPDYLLRFPVEFEDALVVRLERNYRSTSPVVETANRLMRGRPGSLDLRAQSGATGAGPSVTSHADDRREARAVAQEIRGEIEGGTPASQIAVLFRVGAQAAALEAALDDAGIAHRSLAGTRFFELREVKEAIMLLRGATVLVTPDEPLFKTVSDVLRSIGWTQDAPESRGAVRDRWESLDAILRLAEASPSGTTLRAFVDDLLERQSARLEPSLEAVTLGTIHSAKGLEWGSVHVVGVSEGLLPISYAGTERQIDEERRLLYVALTRARNRLSLTWSEQAIGRGGRRSASRFLAELEDRRA
jgi:DNA helicase-2/ATP-dependent DNA helicase PcrA